MSLDHNGYEFKAFARGTILLKSVLTQDIVDLFEYMLFKRFNEYIHYWEANYDDAHVLANDAIDTDYIFNHLDIQMAYITWLDTEEERLQYMKGFKRYLERFLSYSPGTSNGIKEDGSGFHHWTAYNNYMYAYQTVANVLYYMRGTAFTIDTTAYQVFRDAVFYQYMQSNDDNVQALSTSGRNPHNRTRQFSQDRLKKLAIAGGDILSLATADPIFAGMYNRIYGVDVDFVTRLPKNDIGACAMMEMRKRGVGVDKIVYGGDRLGIYFLETGAVSRGSKVVYDRAHSAIAEIESGMIDWDAVFEGVEV